MDALETQLQISKILAQGLDIERLIPQILSVFCQVQDNNACGWYQPDREQVFQLKASCPDAVKLPEVFPSADSNRRLKISLLGNNAKTLAIIVCFSDSTAFLEPSWQLLEQSLGLQIGQYLQNQLDRQREEETATLFAMFSKQMNEAFWICNYGFDKLYYVSPMFADIIGRDLDQLYDNPTLYLDFIHPDDRELLRESARKVKHFPEGLDVDYRIVRPDKTVRWIAARWTPIFNKAGRVDRICGFARDLTKKKEAEARVSEFYSTVSHELRTPLTSIKGALSVVHGGLVGDISEAADELLGIASMETERLIRLINGFLDLRKIELGKAELHLTTVPTGELVENVLSSLRPLADEQKVLLERHIEGAAPIKCDKDRVIQVLTNLVSNALKFSQAGQKIVVASLLRDDLVRFEVRDQGPGISEENMQKLFSIFQQIDCEITRKTGGSGLGLAISKSLVEMHGGRIGVKSVLGQGSTFWFELPQSAAIPSSYRSMV